jgi:UDP-2,4-diacetamido-2,4,6-trideoxy-beta-L-altropyranose hydrolase
MVNNKRKIFFRADGNSIIGLGHITRSLALAEILRDKFEVNFITKYSTDSVKNDILKICSNLIIIPEEFPDIEEPLFYNTYLTAGDIVVLDGYNFDTSYQSELKLKKCKLVCIDDLHNIHFVADVVINHNPAAKAEDYSKEMYTKLYLGFDYTLLRKEFISQAKQIRVLTQFDTVFICIGGADPENLTCRIIQTCVGLPRINKINVVTGSAYRYKEELQKLINESNGLVKHFHNLNAGDMLSVMLDSEIAVCPSSSISLELFCVGVNLITGYFIDNQMELANYIHQSGLGISVGDLKTVNRSLLSKAIVENANNVFYKKQKESFTGNQIENLKNIFESIP